MPTISSPRCDSWISPACTVENEHLSPATHIRCSFAEGHPGVHAAAGIKWTDDEACKLADRG